jgi:hypothetical protein
LTPVTLVLLEEERSHGYELMKRIEEEFGFEQITPGSVYRTLRQMENEGLCRSEWETPSNNNNNGGGGGTADVLHHRGRGSLSRRLGKSV